MPSTVSRQHRRSVLALGSLIALPIAMFGARPANATDFPSKQLRIIVPFAPGGSSDIQARLLAEHLGRHYKQTVLVENKPGAGGHIGGKAVADAPADGHTLMLGSIGLHATYAVYKKLPYKPAKDFKLVTVLAEMPHVVVAPAELPASDMKQLTQLARSKPGALNFGSAGVGSSVHMIGELFRSTADAPMTHIPYRGSAPAIGDLIGGQIQVMFENPPTVLAHIKTGKLKALGVTGKTRLAALPQVPTVAEQGWNGFAATSWTTIAVSAGVSDAIADKLNADIRRVAAAPEFRQALHEQGMSAVLSPREDSDRFVNAERQRWERLIQQANLAAD